MAKFIGELLYVAVSTFIEGWANSFLKQAVQKAGAWLDTKIHGRTTRIVIGMLLGLAAYVLFPIVAGLLSL
jgi:hypothetical protein